MPNTLRSCLLAITALFLAMSLSSVYGDRVDSAAFNARDWFGYLWWAGGFQPELALRSRHIHIQTSHYGLSLNVEKVDIERFGRTEAPGQVVDVLQQGNTAIHRLGASELKLELKIDGRVYQCRGQAGAIPEPIYKHIPYRLINAGRFVQRYDILGLVFAKLHSGCPEVIQYLSFMNICDSINSL